MSKYVFPDEFDCQITDEIKIGWREGSKNKTWYARIYWKAKQQYVDKSLKIPFENSRASFKLATERARKIYSDFYDNVRTGGHYSQDKSVGAMSWRYLDEMEKQATDNELLMQKGLLPKWRDNSDGFWNLEKYQRRSKRHERLKDFFADEWKQSIQKIDIRKLNKFSDWAKKNYSWAPSTINYHITEIRQIWAFAYKNGIVQNIPQIKREPQDLAARSRRFLKEEEWDLMIDWAAKRYNDRREKLGFGIAEQDVDLAYQFYLWLHVISYTGIRPPTGRPKKNLLRWDSYVIENKGTDKETRTFIHNSKVKRPYEAAIMPECWDIFDLLEEHRKANKLEKTYLFQHTADKKGSWAKGDPILSFKTSWKTMLRELNLAMPKGTPAKDILSPYCLRAYYITMRLRHGDVRIEDLARACGTSSKMIEEIYYEYNTRKQFKSLTSGSVESRSIKRERDSGYAKL